MRELPGKKMLSDALLDGTGDLIQDTLTFLEVVEDPLGNIDAMTTLLVLSIIAELPIHQDWLEAAMLPLSGLRSLVDFGWAEHSEYYQLTQIAALALRRRISMFFGDQALSNKALVLERSLGSVLFQAEKNVTDIEQYGRAVEEALAWLKETIPTASTLGAILTSALLPHVVDDLVFPLSIKDLEDASQLLPASQIMKDLNTSLVDFVSAARFQNDGDRFVKSLQVTVNAALLSSTLTASYIKAFDATAFIGQRRHHRHRDVFQSRLKLLPIITQTATAIPQRVVGLKWSVSYVCNTAALAVALGELAFAEQLLITARELFRKLPMPIVTYQIADYQWLHARMLGLDARMTTDRQTKIQKLQLAVESARLTLTNSGKQSRWIHFFLGRIRALIEELWTDAERSHALADALDYLRAEMGQESEWPLDLRTQAAALIRNTASLAADPDERLQKANGAIELLVPAQFQAIRLGKCGDARPLLTLARSYAFAAICHDALEMTGAARQFRQEAQRWVSIALAASPSAVVWELKLRLTDNAIAHEGKWYTEPLAEAKSQIDSELCEEIRKAREWLKKRSLWGVMEGSLALWCCAREWRAQGSLERLASKAFADGRDWLMLDNSERRLALKEKHRARQNQLFSIRFRTGPLIDLSLALTNLESQYQRLVAIYGNHIYDANAALKYLREASRIWPDNHRILAEEARIYRYVWDYGNAILLFRKLATSWPNGEERRNVIVDLIETLLAAAIYGENGLKLQDNTVISQRDLLSEAAALLPQIVHFRKIATDVARLQDRVALELDEEIDWDVVNSTYELVVGGVNLYASTVVKNLAELQKQEEGIAQQIADSVRQNFTSSEALRGMGSLFLRKTEKDRSQDPISDCQKAYATFDACRILENAFLGWRAEAAITSYQRGRAILVASTMSGNANPFPAHLSGKRSLLELAESLFQRAASLSVGNFHFEARRCASRTSRLVKQLAR